MTIEKESIKLRHIKYIDQVSVLLIYYLEQPNNRMMSNTKNATQSCKIKFFIVIILLDS